MGNESGEASFYIVEGDVHQPLGANLYSVKYKASGSNAKKPSEAWVFDGDAKEIYVDGMYIGTEDSLYIKSNKP